MDVQPTVWGVIAALTLLLVVFFIHSYKRKRSNFPPGPQGWPILGNIFQIDPKRPDITLAGWAQQYGGVFSYKFLGQTIVVASNPAAFSEALLSKSNEFSGRPELPRFKATNGNIFSFNNLSPKFSTIKKIMMRSLKTFETEQDHSTLECMDYMLKELQRKGGEAFDPYDDLFHAICKMVLCLLLGQCEELSDQFIKEIRHYLELSQKITNSIKGLEYDIFTWLKYVLPKGYQPVMDAIHCRGKITQKILDDTKANLNETKPRGVADELVIAMNVYLQEDGKPLISEEDVKESFIDTLTPGTLATLLSSYGFMLILVNHPEIQKHIQDEIDDVIGKRRPSSDDRQSMPYLRAVVFELLRFINPSYIMHETTENTSLQGYSLPKNTSVFFNSWALHHDEELWSDPFTFDPTRFLDDKGEIVPPTHRNRKQYIPFGLGLRGCPGEAIALKRLFLLIACLLQKFTILPEDPNNIPSCDPRLFSVGIVTVPDRFKIRVSERHF